MSARLGWPLALLLCTAVTERSSSLFLFESFLFSYPHVGRDRVVDDSKAINTRGRLDDKTRQKARKGSRKGKKCREEKGKRERRKRTSTCAV